ncbi:patatin-like phospholipase family protein [Glutamicibacter sp. X7]
MNSPSSTSNQAATEHALVLGGGGSTGNAWLLGVLAGFAEGGVDLTGAARIIGTSAGATAAAQLAGATPAALYEAACQPMTRKTPPGSRAASPTRGTVNLLAATDEIIAAANSAADMRRRIGAMALQAAPSSDTTAQQRWRATVAARLPVHRWPSHELLITAVDAETGAPKVFHKQSGVDLVDAVAASCSNGFAYSIGAHRYIDGGYRRNENADLAAGCAHVVVLAPFAGRTRHPLPWAMQLDAQLDELRQAGSKVLTIYPAASSAHLFGASAMDYSLRPQAARAGYTQGLARAAEFAGVFC